MMGSGGITNVGPINTPTTGKGAIAGFDPIMKMHNRRTKKRKKMESAGKQWEHRRNDPTYIDGRSKQARKLIKRLSKRKKMTEAVIKKKKLKRKVAVTIRVKRTSLFLRSVRFRRNRNVRSVLQIESKRFK